MCSWTRLPTASLAAAALLSCSDGPTEPGGESPIELTVGGPLSQTVQAGDTKFYVASVTVGAVYRISLTALSDDVDLYAFGDDATFSIPRACFIDRTLFFGAEAEACTTVATGSSMYLAVDASDATSANAAYTIEIEHVIVASLTFGTPLEAAIGDDGITIYSVDITPGTMFTAGISGLSDSATILHVSDGHNQASLVHPASPKEIVTTTVREKLYLAVDGSALTQAAATFRVLAAPAPVFSLPVVPTSGAIPAQTPTVGWVETRSRSQYRTEGLAPGGHTVSILGATGDVSLHVYSDDRYSFELDCTLTSVLGARECAFTGTSVFFSVESGPVNRDGAGYIILVW